MQYKYSIIESEQSTIQLIEAFFEETNEYTCVGASRSKDESLDIILRHNPDVVFINVELNDARIVNELFIEIYKYCKEPPYFIALANNENHAYTCIKNDFFDYLLKPLHHFELRKTMAKLSLKPKVVASTLCLKSNKEYRFIDLEDILYLKADDSYTDFIMNDGTTVNAYQTLKSFEKKLPKNFIRIHNSYIVNQDYVTRINFRRTKPSIKIDTVALPFSKTYKENVVIIEQALSKNSIVSLN